MGGGAVFKKTKIKKKVFRATKDRTLWIVMIDYVLRGYIT